MSVLNDWPAKGLPPVDDGAVCFHCGESVESVKWVFAWHGSTGFIWFHYHCLLDWLPRVFKDIEQIRFIEAFRREVAAEEVLSHAVDERLPANQ